MFYLAQYEGLNPYLSLIFGSIPLFRRSLTTSAEPSLAAICKQVKPDLFFIVGSPPNYKNLSSTSIIFFSVTLCIGEFFPISFMSWILGSAPYYKSISISVLFSAYTAYYITFKPFWILTWSGVCPLIFVLHWQTLDPSSWIFAMVSIFSENVPRKKYLCQISFLYHKMF